MMKGYLNWKQSRSRSAKAVKWLRDVAKGIARKLRFALAMRKAKNGSRLAAAMAIGLSEQ